MHTMKVRVKKCMHTMKVRVKKCCKHLEDRVKSVSLQPTELFKHHNSKSLTSLTTSKCM